MLPYSIRSLLVRFNSCHSRILWALVMVCALSSGLRGSNLMVSSGVRLLPPNRDKIAFQISWDNAWNVNGLPRNHDAVWVFIKVRACGGSWQHALLSTTMADHSVGSALTFARPITNTNRFGNTTGGPHNTGALLRRSDIGIGNIPATPCTLRVSGLNGAGGQVAFDPAVDYEIRIFGIEMVNIPTEGFFVGDGTSTARITQLNVDTQPLQITAENATYNFSYYTAYQYWCSPYYHLKYKNDGTLNATYPKGFDSFYVMKYEITQGQYAAFLNTLPPSVAANRFDPTLTGTNRYAITVSSGIYSTTRTNRGCGYLNWDDLLTYLDWAALRPMTEIEYEKVCRGPVQPTPNEYAWGTNSYIRCTSLQGDGGADTCTTVNANVRHGNAALTGGDAGNGPVDAGLFSRDNTQSRITTGATYYGVMEMSGNLSETIVTVHGNGNPGPSSYTGIWGNGVIDEVTSRWDVADWPVARQYVDIYNTGGACAADQGAPNGLRGGSYAGCENPHWGLGDDHCLRISNRTACTSSYYPGSGSGDSGNMIYGGAGRTFFRNPYVGGRGVR